jgi:hypothetical protein
VGTARERRSRGQRDNSRVDGGVYHVILYFEMWLEADGLITGRTFMTDGREQRRTPKRLQEWKV